jgi:hypothetical protein
MRMTQGAFPVKCLELSPNPYVLILGVPKSGMHLLGRVVSTHPQLAIAPEVDWITGFFATRTGLNLDGQLVPELIHKWVQQKRFDPFGLDRQVIEGFIPPGGRVPFGGFLTRLYDLYGEARGKRLVGCPSLEGPQQIPALQCLWPWTKFVHVIRDGRDVWLYLRDWDQTGRFLDQYPRWREDPLTTAALWWEWQVRLGRQAGSALGTSRYLEVRYEALAARPAEECARLCAFLGLPYDDALPRFHEGHRREDSGLDAKTAWLPITPGLRDWRTQMDAADAERFEAAAGALLDQLGYPRAHPRPRPEALALAAGMRDRFVRDTNALGDWLP